MNPEQRNGETENRREGDRERERRENGSLPLSAACCWALSVSKERKFAAGINQGLGMVQELGICKG